MDKNNKRYYTLDNFYKRKFGSKVAKISLNANFTCPNRDGTKGVGGCIYCSSEKSGEYAGDKKKDIVTQFNDVKKIMQKKWKDAKFIGYFQAGTNTYASVPELKAVFEPILEQENVVGLNIATRPDAITKECLNYLTDLNKRTFLTVELGLQTIHEETSKLINRCHTLKEFEDMVLKLRKRKINVVVHIINGLPYETKEMMLETVKYLSNLDIQGIKIHMLHILKGTKLLELYQTKPFHVLTKDEYIDIVVSQLELLRKDIVIHRLTGDPKVSDLVEPTWLIKKFVVLNDIDKELKRRNTYQGKALKKINLQNLNINDEIMLDDNNDYIVASKIIYKKKTYFYLIKKDEKTTFKILLFEKKDNNLKTVTDNDLLTEIMPLFLKELL